MLAGGADRPADLVFADPPYDVADTEIAQMLNALVDGGWAVLAARARHFLATRVRLRNRLSGGLLIGAGIGLALARKS